MTTRMARFRGGPKDGESMLWDGGHAIKIAEMPPAPLIMAGKPIPVEIVAKTGFYVEDPADPGYFRWNGWR